MKDTKNLLEDPVSGLLYKLALPATVGFLAYTMFNFTDTVYAGRFLGIKALGGLGLSFPFYMIIVAVSSGFSSGVTSSVGQALGQKNHDKAQLYAAQGFLCGLFITLFFTVAGYPLAKILFNLFNFRDPEQKSFSLAYLSIIYGGAGFLILPQFVNSGLSSQGATQYMRNTMFIAAALNVLLDPLFILGKGFIPPMGIRGIALATILVNVITLVYFCRKVLKSPLAEGLCLKDFRPRKKVLKEIFLLGIPGSVNMMTMSLFFFVINSFITKINPEAVSAYSAAVRVEQIILLPSIGIQIACITLVSQNFGALKFNRVMKVRNIALTAIFTFLLLGTLLMYFSAEVLMRIFSDNEDLIRIGIGYLRIEAFTVPAYGILAIGAGIFIGLRKPHVGLMISILRLLILPVTFYTLFTRVFGWGLKGIWLGTCVSVWSGALLSFRFSSLFIHKSERESLRKK